MNITKLRSAHIEWSSSQLYNIFGTLTFAVGTNISLRQAEINWKLFWNKIDGISCQTVKGKQTRIPRHVFVHHGANGGNLHIHFLAQVPGNVENFCVSMNAIWSQINVAHAIPDQNEVTALQSATGASIYVLHEDHRDSVESFSPALSSTAAPVFRDDAIARLTSAVKQIKLLDDAKAAYPKHIARRDARAQKRAV